MQRAVRLSTPCTPGATWRHLGATKSSDTAHGDGVQGSAALPEVARGQHANQGASLRDVPCERRLNEMCSSTNCWNAFDWAWSHGVMDMRSARLWHSGMFYQLAAASRILFVDNGYLHAHARDPAHGWRRWPTRSRKHVISTGSTVTCPLPVRSWPCASCVPQM